MLSKTSENKHTLKKEKGEQRDLCFFFFLMGMMFIANMSSPLHLRQLDNVIYQAVMDDTGVAEVHLARLEHKLTLFHRVSSFVLRIEVLPLRE